MIVKHLVTGGPIYMSMIYIMWIIVIFFAVKFLLNYFSGNKDSEKLTKQNSVILFTGSFAFLLGLFAQMLGMYQALSCIIAAKDIAPSIIAAGIGVSLIAPLYGFGLLLVSGITWFLFRNLLRK